jgi:hypothetical protein
MSPIIVASSITVLLFFLKHAIKTKTSSFIFRYIFSCGWSILYV